MEEPPGGHNHGRARFDQPGWRPLETDHKDQPSLKRPPVPTRHGTLYGYTKQGCRCEFCCLIRAQSMTVSAQTLLR
jgi:hypothetical protein